MKVGDMVFTRIRNRWGLSCAGTIKAIREDTADVNVFNMGGPGADVLVTLIPLYELSIDAKEVPMSRDEFSDVQRVNRLERALQCLLAYHPESPETGAELPREAWTPGYRAAVDYAKEALK